MGLRVELWYWLEQLAGKLWLIFAEDRVSYWLDFLPAWAYRKRKQAERIRDRKQPQGYNEKGIMHLPPPQHNPPPLPLKKNS